MINMLEWSYPRELSFGIASIHWLCLSTSRQLQPYISALMLLYSWGVAQWEVATSYGVDGVHTLWAGTNLTMTSSGVALLSHGQIPTVLLKVQPAHGKSALSFCSITAVVYGHLRMCALYSPAGLMFFFRTQRERLVTWTRFLFGMFVKSIGK